jgi:hypothetical protein
LCRISVPSLLCSPQVTSHLPSCIPSRMAVWATTRTKIFWMTSRFAKSWTACLTCAFKTVIRFANWTQYRSIGDLTFTDQALFMRTTRSWVFALWLINGLNALHWHGDAESWSGVFGYMTWADLKVIWRISDGLC